MNAVVVLGVLLWCLLHDELIVGVGRLLVSTMINEARARLRFNILLLRRVFLLDRNAV